MATVIDALVVTLGLQAKGFKDGADKALKDLDRTKEGARKSAVEISNSGKVAAEFFSRLRREALGLLAIFTAGMGIKSFTENTILGAAGLGRMSANLNMSAKDLATWQLAAKNAGGTAEGITAQLKESADAAARAKYGQFGSSEEWFFRMGGDPKALKDGNTYLQARARIVADLYRVDPSRARYVAQQMGINEDSFNLIKQGPEQIDKLRAAQSGLAEELARAAGPAEKLRQRFDTLENRFRAIGVRILAELMPAFERFLDWLDRLSKWVDTHKEDLVQWVDKSVEAIKTLVQWADKAAQSVGGWQNVLIALGAIKIVGMVSPLLSIAGALAQIASSLGLIGGATGTAGVAALGALVPVAAGVALATYSSNLNQGEPEQLQALNAPVNNREAQFAAIKFFESKGYTRDQAVGLVANLNIESSMNPAAVGDGGKAYGIAQWHADRQAAFKQQFGIDIRQATLQQQLEFVDWELRNTEKRAGDKLRGAKTPQAAAETVSRDFERPAKADWDAERRKAAAGALYGAYVMRDVNSGKDRVVDAAGNSPKPIGQAPVAAANNAVRVVDAASSGQPVSNNNTTTNNTTSTEVHLNGPITVQTEASNMHDLADDLFKQATGNTLASQANTGLR